jgi:replicative superfamily II helicase
MRTTAVPYYRPPFAEYNVAQAAVVPFLDKDMNIVVSFATAVGKTVLAECCFAYHLSEDSDCRCAYVCPYKSLGAEKFKDWTTDPQLSNYGVVLGTGDSPMGVSEHLAGRLSITTSESFDAKTRSEHYAEWIQSLECVVFDEAHLIGDRHRGSAVEASMIRLTRINPGARLVLLSATMGNAMDIAKWVKSLNGKQTKCVTSDWRPSKVDIEFIPVTADSKVEEAVKEAAKASTKKTVVFVHSKITGALVVKLLRGMGVRAVFHNASVPVGKRRKIEAAFNDRMSGLNVLVSTSTLSAGVNIGV